MTTFVSIRDNRIGACRVSRVVCKLTGIAHKLSLMQNSNLVPKVSHLNAWGVPGVKMRDPWNEAGKIVRAKLKY